MFELVWVRRKQGNFEILAGFLTAWIEQTRMMSYVPEEFGDICTIMYSYF